MKYIAFFDTEQFAYENRSIDLAGSNVVDFTADILSRIEEVEIISPVRTLNPNGYFRGRNIRISDRIRLRIPPTFGSKSKFTRCVSLLWIQMWLFWILLTHTKRKERVVVYHSLSTMHVVRLLNWIKNYKLTLEIREIYADVLHLSNRAREKELMFFSIADDYIFPTVELNDQVNIYKKPYTIASGIYRDEKRIASKYDDGKIHLVYAGTLDRLKSGALRSVQIAKYLDERYVIHILGKGVPETLQELKDDISRISKITKCQIHYDGELRGDVFKKYIQKCHIGLALQDLSGIYNMTSFPSKILTYLANGLDVVSPKIPAITTSPVDSLLHYYDNDIPECIADIVRSIKINKSEPGVNRLTSLANELEKNLKSMFYGK